MDATDEKEALDFARKLVKKAQQKEFLLDEDDADTAERIIRKLGDADDDAKGKAPHEMVRHRDIERFAEGTVGYSGCRIERYYPVSGSGISFILELDQKGRKRKAVLKLVPGLCEDFGNRLARSAGLLPPEVYPGGNDLGFMLIEHIDETKGREMFFPGRKENTAIGSVLLLSDIFDRQNEMQSEPAKRFWKKFLKQEGKKDIFRAWIQYHRRCRLCLLGDRRYQNTAIAFAESSSAEDGIAMLPIDTDAVAYDIGLNARWEAGLEAFYRGFASQSFLFIWKMRKACPEKSGNSDAFFEKDIADFLAVLEEEERKGGAADIARMVACELGKTENIGMPFGSGLKDSYGRETEKGFSKVRFLDCRYAESLASASLSMAENQEIEKYISAQKTVFARLCRTERAGR